MSVAVDVSLLSVHICGDILVDGLNPRWVGRRSGSDGSSLDLGFFFGLGSLGGDRLGCLLFAAGSRCWLGGSLVTADVEVLIGIDVAAVGCPIVVELDV